MAGWLSSSLVHVLPVVWFSLGLLKGAEAGDYCLSGLELKYCRYGCCGSSFSTCCSLNVALIVGCVVGGVVCVAFIVTVVCCVIKKQGYRGRVVGPHAMPVAGAGNNVTVVHSNNAAMGYATAPPPPPPPPGPQMYSQGGFNPYGNQPPPPYVYSNPAYPPPPAAGAGGRNVQGGGFAAPAAPGYTPSTAAP